MKINPAETLTREEVVERIDDLRKAHAPFMRDRIRIRHIMNGGPAAIQALLGSKAAAKLNQEDLPVVHLMDSGLTKLAQRLARPPDIKVDVTVEATKTDRKAAEKRERILVGLDYQTRLASTLEYAGRWLPGYAMQPWLIQDGVGRNGQHYAKAEIRNPFDCFPGQWGPDGQPEEIAFIRLASKRRLARQYPHYASELARIREGSNMSPLGYGGTGGIWAPGRMVWEGPSAGDSVLLAEYIDSSGTYLLSLDHDIMIDFVPNPLESGPAFALARRPSFDVMKGQYDHYIGLMGMMAKLNVLAYIASEDAVFRETNIIGDMIGQKYKRGRFSTNFFAPGTRIERPSSDIAFQTFTQIDRVERQLRIGMNYSVVEDSESPNSFATGRGLDKLTESGGLNTEEYQRQLGGALEIIDSKRLEWEENMYGMTLKKVSGNVRGFVVNEEYRPEKDIAGRYESRRVYGMMAGIDNPEVIVTGLQLMSADALDVETFQDNLFGLENKSEINARIRSKKGEDRMFDVLSQRAAEGDPRAEQAMVEIIKSPDDLEEILTELFIPDETEQPTGEDPAALAAALAGGPGGPGTDVVPPEPVSTALSRILGGQADQGVQTVGRL